MSTFAIVEQPFTDHPNVIKSGLTCRQALNEVQGRYTVDEQEDSDFVSILKEGPEGLTTEF